MAFVRDPRYWVPFAALIAIIAIAAVMRGGGSSEATQVVASPTATRAATTPVPAHTATVDEALLDARRIFDIAAAQTALASFRKDQGSYPSTGGAFQILCATHNDAGCALRVYNSKLQASDGLLGYWYQSDGNSYALFSRIEAAPASNVCPAELPPALVGGPVLCATSSQGGQ